MLKISKWYENMPIILIVLAMVIILLSYTGIISHNSYIDITIFVLFFLSFFVELIQDIKNRSYSTYLLIIIVDVLEIIALIAFCVFYYHSYDKTDLYLLVRRKLNMRICVSLIALMILIKSSLESKRFEKKQKVKLTS